MSKLFPYTLCGLFVVVAVAFSDFAVAPLSSLASKQGGESQRLLKKLQKGKSSTPSDKDAGPASPSLLG